MVNSAPRFHEPSFPRAINGDVPPAVAIRPSVPGRKFPENGVIAERATNDAVERFSGHYTTARPFSSRASSDESDRTTFCAIWRHCGPGIIEVDIDSVAACGVQCSDEVLGLVVDSGVVAESSQRGFD
jgi:hypothetical protein